MKHSNDNTLLHRRRILVVEDEPLVAMLLKDSLTDAGCAVSASARLRDAIEIAAVEDIDCAYLDIDLDGEEVYPVAEILSGRSIPYVLATAHNSGNVAPEYRHSSILFKPFAYSEFEKAIYAALLSRARMTKISAIVSPGTSA
jgi:DNA-binding response OmpR family regulator